VILQGLKPVIFLGLIGTTKQLAEKSEGKAKSAKGGLAGAEARLVLLTLLARLKPCRCYKAARLSFSASCKVVP